MAERPTYSLVLPVYNEEAALPLLLPRLDALLQELDGPTEVIFVDDGSRDLTRLILEQRARVDRRYKYVALSRNFGHQIAVTTGLDLSRGRAVVVMDADLQDPPEVVLALAARWREGWDVVSARRRCRQGESRFKKATAHVFYRLVSRIAAVEIPEDVGDFRLIDRKVVDAFCGLRERERFVRGLFAWLGYRQTVVEFERPARAAGKTKYSLRRMLALAVNGVISFSEAPLLAALWGGLVISGLALVYALFVVAQWWVDPDLVRGWSSSVFVAAFLGGANMMMTGVMGLYVGRIYSEVKARPLYLIDRQIGFDLEGDVPVDRTTAQLGRSAAEASIRLRA